jgi:hypothetical protein
MIPPLNNNSLPSSSALPGLRWQQVGLAIIHDEAFAPNKPTPNLVNSAYRTDAL